HGLGALSRDAALHGASVHRRFTLRLLRRSVMASIYHTSARRHPGKRLLGIGVSHLVLIALSIIFVTPLYWMVTTSLKSNPQLYTIPPTWFPHPLQWNTYPDAVNFIPFFTFLKISVLVTALTVVGTLLSC